MIRPVVRVFSLVLLLVATTVPSLRAAGSPALPGSGAGARSTAGPAPGGATRPDTAAISRYLSARLLDERGLDSDALDQYREVLRLDPGHAAIELRVSEIYARMGESAKALEYVDLALAHEPGQAHALWLRGGALFNLGRTAESLDALRAAVAADPGQAEYWRTLAHVAESLGRVDVVADAWRHAVELDDSDAESWFQLAAVEARLGHFAAADSLLGEAVALNPARPGALFLEGWIQEGLGRPAEAARLYREHLKVHPDDQATRRRLVNLLAGAGRFAEAYREAVIVSNAQPGDLGAIGVEADLALRLGHIARAQELLDRMVQADPDDPALVLNAAGILAARGRGREAVARAEEWSGRHVGDYRGVLVVATARADAGDTTGALEAARRSVAMAPDSLAPRFVLGGLLQASRRYAPAESVWLEVTRMRPTAVRAGLELAYCRQSQGNVEGTVSALREVLARDPDNAAALNFLGYLFAERNRDLAEAEDLIRRALAKDPDNGAYVDSMGWVYYRLGRLTEARRELERAVDLTRGDPVVLEHLGDVYKDLGLLELAREQYRRSLSRVRDNARVKAKLTELR